MRIAVLGGGVSGLSLSWFLKSCLAKTGKRLDVTVYETAPRIGGWFQSLRVLPGYSNLNDKESGRHQRLQTHPTYRPMADNGLQPSFLFELGPHSMRPVGVNGSSVLELISGLQLLKDALPTDASAKVRHIYTNGTLHTLPSSMSGMLMSPLTRRLPYLALQELTQLFRQDAKRHGDEDESIRSFFSRCFDEEVADTLIDAMVSGIYAGDIDHLSAKACFRSIHQMKAKDKSLVYSILKSSLSSLLASYSGSQDDLEALIRRLGDLSSDEIQKLRDLRKATGISFKDGIQTLTDTIALDLFYGRTNGLDLRDLKLSSSVETQNATFEAEDGSYSSRLVVNAEITDITASSSSGGLTLTHREASKNKGGISEICEYDHVFSTIPLDSLCRTVMGSSMNAGAADVTGRFTDLEELHRRLQYVDVATINLGFKTTQQLPVTGFGHLIPRKENTGILGVLYDSKVFPDQLSQPKEEMASGKTSGGEQKLGTLTVMCGGANAPHVSNMSPSELLELGLKGLETQLGIREIPSAVHVQVIRNAIPQYFVGFDGVRDRAIEQVQQSLPGLKILGNNFYGVGIADSIHEAKLAAIEFADSLNEHNS